MAESDNESGSQTTGNTGGGGRGGCREQDRLLPIANVGRIMKKALPANAKISKEAKETVQECVSEFISFVTGEASEKCQKEKRKTVNGDDLLWAITTLGFQDYVDPLKIYLHKYREVEGEKTSAVMVGRHHQISDQEDRDEMLVGTGGVYGNSTTMMMMNNAFGSGSGSPRRTM